MRFQKVKEGKVEFFVPIEEKLTKKVCVFYNPVMKFDRDLSEIIISILKPKKICDCLAASGIRGLRYKSVLENSEVVVNDRNPTATKLIEKNAKLNKLRVKIENKDANILLIENGFDFIDIDPFGSPIYFLDAAAKSIRNNGIISMTATDTAPLCGTSPLTCLRRYGIRSYKVDFMKELGLRILISAIIKNFSRYDQAFNPIFSYYRMHYFRVFGRIERGCGKANKLLKQFDYLSYCPMCGFRKKGRLEQCEYCKNKIELIGPIYLNNFASKEFCNKILKKWWEIVKEFEIKGKLIEVPRKEFEYFPNISRFIRIIKNEQGFPPYFDIHKICKLNKKQQKKMRSLLDKLKGERTHFTPLGIKTKKSFKEVLEGLDYELKTTFQ